MTRTFRAGAVPGFGHGDLVDRDGVGAAPLRTRDRDSSLGSTTVTVGDVPGLLALLRDDHVEAAGDDGARLVAREDGRGDQGVELIGLVGGQHGDRLGDHLAAAAAARAVPEPGAELGRDRDLARRPVADVRHQDLELDRLTLEDLVRAGLLLDLQPGLDDLGRSPCCRSGTTPRRHVRADPA